MQSHNEVAKRIFEDAKDQTNRQTEPAKWDLITGLSELCLAVEALQVDVDQLKTLLRKREQPES
jgi:hypothetical protein